MSRENETGVETETQLKVRPYLLTGGRTESDIDITLEAMLATTELGHTCLDEVHLERKDIIAACTEAVSLTELAARLDLPIQVARVLIGDLISEGLVVVTATADFSTDRPDLGLLERVLDGLQSL